MSRTGERLLTLRVDETLSGRRVRSLLVYRLKLPEHQIAVLKRREGSICLNARPCRTVDTVRAGDVLTVDVSDAPEARDFPPCTVRPEICYEDEDLVVLNKSAGMAVHGEARGEAPTVEQMMAGYWGTDQPFHPVNRLDRGTSGLMVIARSSYAHERLRQLLHTDDFRREYLAVLHGVPENLQGSITLALRRESEEGTRRVPAGDGQSAHTEYTVLAECSGETLVRVRLFTGRTHQIRAHFAAVGCPLIGDTLYGTPDARISRPALHSVFLQLRQPITGQIIRCTAPLPKDLEALCSEIAPLDILQTEW